MPETEGPHVSALYRYPVKGLSPEPLEQVSLSESIGEYAITRLDGGTRRLYLIYFMPDAGGVWRVDGM